MVSATSVATKYNAGGVLLDRPCKIRRLGHFGLLGFRASDEFARGGWFLRFGTDHHAFAVDYLLQNGVELQRTGREPVTRRSLDAGFRPVEVPGRFDVDGILLPRPVKIVSHGPRAMRTRASPRWRTAPST